MPSVKPLSPAIVHAVRRYQRNLVTEARKDAAIDAEGWSDEVLERERVDITHRARRRAHRHLKAVLLADASERHGNDD